MNPVIVVSILGLIIISIINILQVADLANIKTCIDQNDIHQCSQKYQGPKLINECWQLDLPSIEHEQLTMVAS